MTSDAVAAATVVLATATPDGAPSARAVLLRGFDRRGFVFFTDHRSRKAAELAANPRAALVWLWAPAERQVRVEGTVGPQGLDPAESDAYFANRPRGHRLAAWASHQSSVISSRDVLEAQMARVTARFEGVDVPRPPHWGGYRLTPAAFEFWQGRPNRLHDRLRFRSDGGQWVQERLSP